MEDFDVIIIGSGFCGSIVASELSRSGISFKVIEPSSHIQPVDIRWTKNSIFSKDKFLQTAGLGGGRSVWGKAISFASDKNWFIPRGNLQWEENYDRIRSVVLPKELKLPSPKRRQSRFVSRFFPNLGEEFFEEVGRYAGKKLGKSNTSSLPAINRLQLLECTILDITKNEGVFQVSCRDLRGGSLLLTSRVIVLASGTVLNACLYSLATGVKHFPFSNHFGADFGEIILRKPVLIRDGIQTYSEGESDFSTFARKLSSLSWYNSPNSAIRLQSNVLNLTKTEIIDSLMNFRVKRFFNYVVPGLMARYLKLRLINRISLRIVADQRINDTNSLTIDDLNDGKFSVTVKIEMSELVEQDAHDLLNQFIEIFKVSEIVGNAELRTLDEVSWEDTAHYFGSTPIGRAEFDSSLTSQSESGVLKGLFVVGNSTFPEGSHGHPTLLGMQLAQLVAECIVSQTDSAD